MTVQIPDPGLGDGRTGDNEYVFRSKVKSNFSDQSNAASRLVGTEDGQVPSAEQVFKAAHNQTAPFDNSADLDVDELQPGERALYGRDVKNIGIVTPDLGYAWLVESVRVYGNNLLQRKWAYKTGEISTRTKKTGESWTPWLRYYNTNNTTKDSNGFLKGASPVIDLYKDKIELNADAQRQDIEFNRNGVGDYTLLNTTGLANEGWYIELPKDANGNPKFAVVYEDDGKGNISVKTYKRVFDFETFLFGPDLTKPVDITDGRFISIRLNDLPETDDVIE